MYLTLNSVFHTGLEFLRVIPASEVERLDQGLVIYQFDVVHHFSPVANVVNIGVCIQRFYFPGGMPVSAIWLIQG